MLHGRNGNGGPLCGNGGGNNNTNAAIFQYCCGVGDTFGIGVFFTKFPGKSLVGFKIRNQFRPGPDQAVALSVNMVVLNANGGKFYVSHDYSTSMWSHQKSMGGSAFQAGCGNAFNQQTLEKQEEEKHRHQRQGRHGKQPAPLR